MRFGLGRSSQEEIRNVDHAPLAYRTTRYPSSSMVSFFHFVWSAHTPDHEYPLTSTMSDCTICRVYSSRWTPQSYRSPPETDLLDRHQS